MLRSLKYVNHPNVDAANTTAGMNSKGIRFVHRGRQRQAEARARHVNKI